MLKGYEFCIDRTGKNVLFVFMSIFCLISCREDEALPKDPPCIIGVNRLSVAASETALGTSDITSGPCDVSMNRYPTTTEGRDSIIIYAIFGFASFVEIKLYNVRSQGEYELALDRAQGEPYVVCNFSHTTSGYDAFHDYSSDPNGSGLITIDSISPGYIKGTITATLVSADSLKTALLNGEFHGIL